MSKQAKKELLNPIRYKTFSLAPTSEFEIKKSFEGSKLVSVYTAKEQSDGPVYRFIGTSEAKDRDGEIVLMDGWDFKNYNNNSIVLWGHDSRSLPIGKTVGILKDEVNKAIYFDVQFSESYDFAKTVKGLVEEGILKAVSLGFRVTDWEWSEKLDALLLTKSELFELSIVTVPANQEALFQGIKAIEVSTTKSVDEDVSDLANVVRELKIQLEAIQAAIEPSSEGEPELDSGNVGKPETSDGTPQEGTEPRVEEPILKTPDISAELIEQIVQAVVSRIQPTEPEVKDEEVDVVTDDVVEDKLDENPDEPKDESDDVVPEPEAEEDGMVVVSVEDLSETDSFIIVNEEEN